MYNIWDIPEREILVAIRTYSALYEIYKQILPRIGLLYCIIISLAFKSEQNFPTAWNRRCEESHTIFSPGPAEYHKAAFIT